MNGADALPRTTADVSGDLSGVSPPGESPSAFGDDTVGARTPQDAGAGDQGLAPVPDFASGPIQEILDGPSATTAGGAGRSDAATTRSPWSAVKQVEGPQVATPVDFGPDNASSVTTDGTSRAADVLGQDARTVIANDLLDNWELVSALPSDSVLIDTGTVNFSDSQG